MRDTDRPRPAHPELPPSPQTAPRLTERLAALHERWSESWANGLLYRRWEDVRHMRKAGWHGAANWLKATSAVIAICLAVMMIDTAADIVLTATDQLAAATPTPSTSHEFWAVVDNPVRTYIDEHTGASLPVAAPTVHAAWQAIGLFGLVGGFFYNTGARITFTVWGCASLAMVWSATPADSRVIATGLAALGWAMASAFALRGLSLRPVVHNHPAAAPVIQPQIRPELHIHATIPAPAPTSDGPDDPGNLRQLPR